MLRKIFGGTMVLSLTAAVVLGGAFAWTNSKTQHGSNQVGNLDFAMTFEQILPKPLLGPNNGVPTNVGHVELDNTGTFPLKFTGGTVAITSTDEEKAPDDGLCLAKDFSGAVVVSDPHEVVAPGGQDKGIGQVYLTVLPSASSSCMTRTIGYDVTMTVDTNIS